MTEAAALGRAAVRGVGWGALATGVNLTAQIGFMAVMARLLDPADFGLVAMAHIGLRFLSYFAQLGVAPALVQKPELDPQDIRVALTLSVLVGVGMYVLAWLAAPLAGRAFGSAELAPVLRALALTLVVSGVSAVSVALLRRDMRFRHLAIVDTFAYLVGYGTVGVGCALAGLGVWSLVAAVLGQALVTAGLAWVLGRHPLRLTLSLAGSGHFLRFGSKYSLIGFLEYLGSNVDSILVGRVLGDAMLGLYNRAQMLVRLPVYYPVQTLTKVLFPVLSSAQGDVQTLRRAYIGALVLVAALAGAFTLALVPAAPAVVSVLLGERWLPAAPIVQVATFAVPLLFVNHVSGTVCDARGQLLPKLGIQMFALVVLAGALTLLHSRGATGFAAAMVAAEGARTMAYLPLHWRRLGLGGREGLRAGVAVLAIWVPVGTASLLAAHWAGVWAFSAWASLALTAGTVSVALALGSVPAWCVTTALIGAGALRDLGHRAPVPAHAASGPVSAA